MIDISIRYAMNKKSKTHAVHILEEGSNTFTLCGVCLLNFIPISISESKNITPCKQCFNRTNDDIDTDFDPLGLLDDDMPDGAYWAMHNEFYGY